MNGPTECDMCHHPNPAHVKVVHGIEVRLCDKHKDMADEMIIHWSFMNIMENHGTLNNQLMAAQANREKKDE